MLHATALTLKTLAVNAAQWAVVNVTSFSFQLEKAQPLFYP